MAKHHCQEVQGPYFGNKALSLMEPYQSLSLLGLGGSGLLELFGGLPSAPVN